MEPADVVGRRFEDAFSTWIWSPVRFTVRSRPGHPPSISRSGTSTPAANIFTPLILPFRVKDADGKLLAVIEVANDVTQLSELCDRLAHLQVRWGRRRHPKNRSSNAITFPIGSGRDPKFQKSMERAKRAAQNDMPVLIDGETGTGKELFAQSIHYGGTRSGKPFIAQNCAALPRSCWRASVSAPPRAGSPERWTGRACFELANDGTLLLDELNSMPYELQSKLLRVLQESYIRRRPWGLQRIFRWMSGKSLL